MNKCFLYAPGRTPPASLRCAGRSRCWSAGRRLQSRQGAGRRKLGGSGPGALDAALPEGGLTPGGLHEAAGAALGDGPAAGAFLAALLARLRRRDERRAVLVCQSRTSPFGRLYGPGWRDLGLEPADLLLLSARRDRDVAWAMEEGLRSASLAGVLGEVESLDFTLSRRLALAARESLTPALLLRRDGLATRKRRLLALAGRGFGGAGGPVRRGRPRPAALAARPAALPGRAACNMRCGVEP